MQRQQIGLGLQAEPARLQAAGQLPQVGIVRLQAAEQLPQMGTVRLQAAEQQRLRREA